MSTQNHRKEVQELLDKAAKLGFEVDSEKSGRGHITLVHPRGEYTIASTPSDWRGEKNAVAAMERISGEKLARVSHRRSRKAVARTDFSIDRAIQERNTKAGETIDRLMNEHQQLIEKFKWYAQDGEDTSRTKIVKCMEIVKRMTEIEAVLKEFHQPVEAFNPVNIL